MTALFGPAGNPGNFPYRSSAEAPRWLAGLGLDCYEYQCGRGVSISKTAAQRLGEEARTCGIQLSLHAPYYINLANPAAESLQKNIRYILDSCRAAHWMGAERVVVHTGAVMKRSRREALNVALDSMREILRVWEGEGFSDVALCPETMGKINQLGDLDEVLEICSLDERLIPCVDFGHLYARSLGKLTGPDSCVFMLDRIETVLGPKRASRFHAHFSRIEFTQNGGEKCHRSFDDNGGFGPEPGPLMAEVARRGWGPTFICESAGTQASDALVMKELFQSAILKRKD